MRRYKSRTGVMTKGPGYYFGNLHVEEDQTDHNQDERDRTDMREIIIKENEAGQRLDKFLKKYMKEAPASFFYKMLRKKILY